MTAPAPVVAPCIVPLHPDRILRGTSSTVETEGGRRLIDMTGGLGALILGYAHPRVTEAIRAQAGRLVHASYPTMPFAAYEQVAAWLAARFRGPAGPFASALFNSGAEAVENAMKIAAWVTGRPAFLALRAGFHGRTLGAASLTYRAVPYRAGIAAAMPRVVHLTAPQLEPGTPPQDNAAPEDPAALARAMAAEVRAAGLAPDSIAGVIYEPIQGEGGIRRLTPAYLRALRIFAADAGALLISDEIQSGCGRTGVWFPSWVAGAEPDIVVSGKALGGGLPLSAVSAPAELLARLMRGALGGTMGGNPLACAAGLATLAEIEEAGLMTSAAAKIEARFRAAFRPLAGRRIAGCDVRLHAHGAMLAAEFVAPPGRAEGSASA
ncbi:MAG TPA: aminotransferase class III-fold pyridoxal phosphate-dependent enzyme, partial [Crenalkalicoccus sp.]|nr:aminotransferase class III-fold pyridoxal phosphate-dependent enzyme [Crenalkalicoccus sp.]